MTTTWKQIIQWGAAQAPGMINGLNEGASEEEIAGLEAGLGLALPAALRSCLLENNGETAELDSGVFADLGTYLSVDEIRETWQQRKQVAAQMAEEMGDRDTGQLVRDGIIFVEGPVRPVLFHEAWVPFSDRNGDVFWAIDFAPAAGGTKGQVIEVDWEGCSWKVVAPSFERFLSGYASDLAGGEYEVVDGVPTRG